MNRLNLNMRYSYLRLHCKTRPRGINILSPVFFSRKYTTTQKSHKDYTQDDGSNFGTDAPTNIERQLYTPLDRSRREIRLIEIISTKPKIVCNLTTVSLDDNPRFSALSYLWGDTGNTEKIVVNGVEKTITPTLANALEYVPYHWKREFPQREPGSCLLWADALCINQDDDVEKGHQVQLMSFIYPAAELVFSCLDIEAQESDIHLAFETCERIAKSALKRGLILPAFEYELAPGSEPSLDLEWVLEHPFLDENYPMGSHQFNEAKEALFSVLTLNYWQRAWVFQELVLANRPVVVHRFSSIPLDEFLKAQSYVRALRSAELKARPNHTNHEFWHSGDDHFRVLVMVDWARCYVHQGIGLNETVLQLMRCITLLTGGRFGAKNPKDHVYALLGITKLSIEPDYTNNTSVASVYMDACAEILKLLQSASLDFSPLMFLKGAGLRYQDESQQYELPTWAFNFAQQYITDADPDHLFKGYQSEPYPPDEWNNLEAAVIHGNHLICPAVFITTVVQSSPSLDSSPNAWSNFVSSVCRMICQLVNSSAHPHPLLKLTRAFGNENPEMDVWESPEVIRLTRIFQYLLFLDEVSVDEEGGVDDEAFKIAGETAEFMLNELNELVLKQADDGLQQNFNEKDNIARDCQEFISRIRDTDSFWEDLEKETVHEDVGLFLNTQPRVCWTESGEFVVIPRVAEKGDQVVLIPGHFRLSLIRRIDDRFVYVGDCWSSRPMQEIVEEARTGEVERIEIW